MKEIEKKKITQRLLSRVFTGLSFMETNYLDRYSKPDLAWIRNIYILLSFYTELLLKAIFIIKGNFADKAELEKKIRRQGHNLELTAEEINKTDLTSLGIKKVIRVKHEYLIETDMGDFYVNDFIDIRYDFLDNRVRTLNGNEHDKFKEQIKIMHEIIDKLKPLVW